MSAQSWLRLSLTAGHDAASVDAALARGEAWLAMPGHTVLGLDDAAYPTLLREIHRPPSALFISGDQALLGMPQIAIVGSRNATPGGAENAHRFAEYLAAHGFCITSGLAEGIDAAAHRGALAGGGKTIAVCGTGLDEVYPRRHAALAAEIVAAGGALVSEFAPGTPVRRDNFPRRNRIISGLSLGTLVVEAGQTSGALITARHATEQGREVFAIPGSIHNPLSRGCHRLIRNGAKLVETAADIVEELGGLLGGVGTLATAGQVGAERTATQDDVLDSDYTALLDAMGFDPVDVDTLAERVGLTGAEVSSMLLVLELRDRVQSLTGGRYLRVATRAAG